MLLFMKTFFLFIILISSNFSLAPLILPIMINSYFQLYHISQLILQSQFILIHIFSLHYCLFIFPHQHHIFKMKKPLHQIHLRLFHLILVHLNHYFNHLSFLSASLIGLNEFPHTFMIIIATWCLRYLFPN